MVVSHKLEHQKCRCDAECDGVAKAVELGAKVGGVLRPAGGTAIEHVEHHAKKYQNRCHEQLVPEPPADTRLQKVAAFEACRSDLGGKRNRPEPADGITERQQ